MAKFKHIVKDAKDNRSIKVMLILTAINIALFIVSLTLLCVAINKLNDSVGVSQAQLVSKTSSSLPKVKSSSSEAKSKKSKSSSQTSTTETQTAETTAAVKVKFPGELKALLSKRGLTEDSITQAGIAQLITVVPNLDAAHTAQIEFYELHNCKWKKSSEYSCSGYVGYLDTIEKMAEGESGTPRGLYSIGEAFYQYDAPATKLKSFKITENTYWIDDPNSQYYNKRVEGSQWGTSEHMSAIPQYKYGFVINYNADCVPGKGSAIFFHLGSSATQGCVATSEEYVLKYLAALDASKNPNILIV